MVIPRLYGAPVWRWHHQHRWCPYGYQPALPLHATRVAGNCTHAMLSHTTVFFGWKGHVNETKWDQWACTGLLPITMNSEKIINFVWKYIWWGIVGRFLEWVGAPRADLTPWLTLNHGCLPPNEWILSELLFSRSGPDLMWQQCLELNLKTKESNHFNISISGDLDMLDV